MDLRFKDSYQRKAKSEGYVARSVYKLKEIQEKYHLVKKGDSILDLGCAPGSWLQYLSKEVGENGKVVGYDLKEIRCSQIPNVVFFQKDVQSLGKDDFLKGEYNVVVSDLAPSTAGIKFIDSARSLELAQQALLIAEICLKQEGNFVCKVFASEETQNLFQTVKNKFRLAKRFRPKAVRKHSREFYIIGLGAHF